MSKKKWFNSFLKSKKVLSTLAATLVLTTTAGIASACGGGSDKGDSQTSSTIVPDVKYTVTFDTVGGSAIEAVTVKKGGKVSQPVDPVLAGYKFGGWYTDANYTTKFHFTETINGDITLYARWYDITMDGVAYNLSFDLNYGGKKLQDQETFAGRAINLPVPEREGYTFGGWWVSMYDSADMLSYECVEDMEVKENLTLYAHWIPTDAKEIVVDVQGDKIVWDAVEGIDRYHVEVTGPEGFKSIYRDTNLTSWDVDFANQPAGEYVIKVSPARGTEVATAVRYYKNKALARVSNFKVAGDFLAFNEVDGAEEYFIQVECDNPAHNHTFSTLGQISAYDFSACHIGEEGIKFTVKAVAEGYVESVSKTYVLNRTLDVVSGLKVNTNEQAVWTAVEGATEYEVKINSGSKTDTFVTVDTSIDLRGYAAGNVNVTVIPTSRTYHCPEASTIAYNKTSPAAPAGIVLDGNTITWDATDASKYNVYIAGKKFETTTNSLTLKAGTHYEKNAETIEVSIVAVGATEAQATDTYMVGLKKVANIAYAKNTLTWSPVVGAAGYQVSVNGAAPINFNANVTSTPITLTAKENEITVSALINDQYTAATSYTVNAFEVSFDACGGDVAKTQYLATGDILNLPETYQSGYVNNGWFTAPNGAALGAWDYEDGCIFNGVRDTVIYASWTGKSYTITYNYVDGNNEHVNAEDKVVDVEIAYDSNYVLEAPVSKNEEYVFIGWFSEANGMGTQYTNAKGESLGAWTIPNNASVYAHWAKVFEFELEAGEYVVRQSKDLAKYADSIPEITIPAYYKGVKVTVVAGEAFSRCKQLKVINIPNTIKTIETDSAFQYCNSLEAVNIYEVDDYTGEIFWSSADGVLIQNDSITQENILKFVPRMKSGSFTIPNTVTEIPTAVFADWLHDCYIEELIIPASVKTIQTEAFYNCKYLQSVRFLAAEDGETAEDLTIDARAFRNCDALQSVSFPARLVNMSMDMFYECGGLEEIHVEEGNAQYSSSQDGSLLNVAGDTLVMVPIAKSGTYTIPEGVTAIEAYAFAGCKDITEIVIPWHVTDIKAKAFVGYKLVKGADSYTREEVALDSITKVTFEGGSPTAQTIGDSAFANLASLTEIVIEEDVNITTIGANAFAGTSITNVIIPASVTTIGGYAFANTNITEVTIKEGTTLTINAYAFANTGLKTITIPQSVATIENAVFAGCEDLENVEVVETNANYTDIDGVLFNKAETEILFYPMGRKGAYVLPTTVTTIGANVFQGNNNLTEITLGATVTSVGDYAFDSCYGLSKVNIAEDGETLTFGSNVFANCVRLTEIVLPARVSALSNYMFYASSLEDIEIKGAITSIPTYAFAATNMSEIEIPATVTSFGNYAFAGSPIVNFVIPAKVTSIGTSVFANCVNLNKVSFAEGATINNIPSKMFQKTSLREFVVPASVTTINTYAFDEATLLSKVTFEEGSKLTSIKNYAFRKCYSLTSFDLPDSVTVIGASSANSAASYAFQYCYNLKTFNIGENSKLNTIGTYAFQYCGIEYIKLPKTIKYINSYSFAYTHNLKKVDSVLGGSVSLTVKARAFMYSAVEEINFSKKLTTMDTISNTSTSMGLQFAYCRNLKAINVEEGGTAYASVDGILYDKDKKTLWHCPEGKEGEVVIPNTVTVVKGMAFRECTKITSVVFEELAENATGSLVIGETTIKDPTTSTASATYGRPNTTFSASTTHVGHNGAFYGCTALASVKLPQHVTHIGKMAFENNASLKEISIPASVTKIDDYAFLWSGLETVTFEGESKVAYIGKQAFAVTNLKSIEIPATVTEIGERAFDVCSDLASVTFAEGTQIATIGARAFEYDAKLTAFTLPETLTSVGDSAFGGTGITSLAISAGINQIKPMLNGMNLTNLTIAADHALYKIVDGIVYDKENNNFQFLLASVEEIRVESGTTSIPEKAFAGLTLKKVIIPATVTQIGTNVFEGAYIDEVIFEDGEDDLVMPNAFMDSYVKKVVIPKRVTDLGRNAFTRATAMESIVFEAGSRITEFETYITYTSSGEATGFTMGSYAFFGLVNLTELVLPDTLTGTLPQFRGLNKLEKLVVPEGITTIAQYTFGDTGTQNNMADPNDPNYGYKCDNLKEIILPSTLTTIEKDAFMSCRGLEKLTIPASVTTLGSGAFSNCINLKEVIFEEGSTITEIPEKTFGGDYNLKTVVLPEGITSIGRSAFGKEHTYYSISWTGMNDPALSNEYTSSGQWNPMIEYYDFIYYCNNLESVNIANVTAIGESAFECAEKVNFVGGYPQGITSLGANAFKGAGITEAYVPASVVTIGAESFKDCANLTSVTIEEGIAEIGASAFENCVSLTTIEIPKTVQVIGAKAFSNCPVLANVTMNDNEAYTLENGILMDIDKKVIYGCFNKEITNLVIPEGVKELAPGAFANSAITSITFNSDLQIIGDNAFAGCTNLTKVELPSDTTAIGNSVFQNCSSLSEVVFSDNLRTIGNYAFQGTALKKVHIGENVISIGSYAFAGLTELTEFTFDLGGVEFLTMGSSIFYGCSSMKTITLPRRGSVIPSSAFTDCTSLESIHFDEGTGATRQGTQYFSVVVGNYAFTNCTSLKSIHFPAHFGNVPAITATSRSADIGYNAFENCTLLESVTFEDPSTLRKMGSGTFKNCTSLKEFHFPESMDLSDSSLGSGTFEGCTSLTTVTMPKMIGTYASSMFKNSGIKEVIIPAGATKIGNYMFEGCTQLEKVVIPDSVTIIGTKAFYGCTSLKEVNIPNSVTQIGDSNYGGEVFAGCTSLTELVLPSSVLTMDVAIFYGWTADQTIKVAPSKGESGLWKADWNKGCNATFVWGYLPE